MGCVIDQVLDFCTCGSGWCVVCPSSVSPSMGQPAADTTVDPRTVGGAPGPADPAGSAPPFSDFDLVLDDVFLEVSPGVFVQIDDLIEVKGVGE